MNNENMNLLEEEIKSELEIMKEVENGSDEYKVTIDGLTKLMDRAIEMEKIKNEHEEKLVEMAEEKKDRLIKNSLTAASIISAAGLTIWGTLKSLKFEEEGTVTTLIGRGFINKLLPKK